MTTPKYEHKTKQKSFTKPEKFQTSKATYFISALRQQQNVLQGPQEILKQLNKKFTAN